MPPSPGRGGRRVHLALPLGLVVAAVVLALGAAGSHPTRVTLAVLALGLTAGLTAGRWLGRPHGNPPDAAGQDGGPRGDAAPTTARPAADPPLPTVADPGTLLAAAPIGVGRIDRNGALQVANPRLATLLGAGTTGEVLGAPLWHGLLASDHDPTRRAVTAAADAQGTPTRLVVRLAADPERYLQLRLAADGAGSGDLVVSVDDVSAEVHRQQELHVRERTQRDRAVHYEHQARHDALTGLANRTQLGPHLEGLLAAGQSSLVFLCLDLDGFKPVNDTLGHDAGDRVLQVIGSRLAASVRGDDLPARLGGDEFAVVLRPLTDRAEAEAIARRILRALAEPIDLAGTTVRVTGSIGLAAPGGATDAGALLRAADLAMYAAKRAGGGQLRWAVPATARGGGDLAGLESDLRRALVTGGVGVVFQPVVDLTGGRDHAVEVLARWDDPGRGEVPPRVFLPVAAGAGLLGELNRQVLTAATAAAASWQVAVTLAVNLNGAALRAPGLVRTLRTILDRTGLAAGQLLVEVAVTELVADPGGLAAVLGELRRHGLRTGAQDVLLGRPSPRLLASLPLDEVKLGPELLVGIDREPDRQTAVAALVAELEAAGRQVVATGVETPAQRAALPRLGIDLAQGFGLVPPLAAEAQAARALDQLSRRR